RVCAAARLFLVSVSYVSKVIGRRYATGETTARRWVAPKPSDYPNGFGRSDGVSMGAARRDYDSYVAAN
ncbi:MAG: hypothetical protein WCA56_21130, partial [Xanthobacteraceae bacterium]